MLKLVFPCAKECSKIVGKVERVHLACWRCRMRKLLTQDSYRESCDLSLFPHFVFPPNSDIVSVYIRYDRTVLIVDDRNKRFSSLKDVIMHWAVSKAEKEGNGRFRKHYIELIELCCR